MILFLLKAFTLIKKYIYILISIRDVTTYYFANKTNNFYMIRTLLNMETLLYYLKLILYIVRVVHIFFI